MSGSGGPPHDRRKSNGENSIPFTDHINGDVNLKSTLDSIGKALEGGNPNGPNVDITTRKFRENPRSVSRRNDQIWPYEEGNFPQTSGQQGHLQQQGYYTVMQGFNAPQQGYNPTFVQPNGNWQNVQQFGVPANPNNGYPRQRKQAGFPLQFRGSGYEGPQPSLGGGGYHAGPQEVHGFYVNQGPRVQPQQQGNWHGQYISQGPMQKSRSFIPEGDYVYYDTYGNQVVPPGQGYGYVQAPHPNGTLDVSGWERYYGNHPNNNNQQTVAALYSGDRKIEEKKKRKRRVKRGATALAAGLLALWVCTCCCHAPCGF